MRQRFVQGWGGDSHLFLDDKRRQTDRADGLAKPAKALRRDIHLRLRVFARERWERSGAGRRSVPGAFPAVYGAVFVGRTAGDMVNAPLAALRAPVG